jgi:hypothetical protein
MDENGMKLWLEKVWSKRSGGFLKKATFSVWPVQVTCKGVFRKGG